MVHSLIQSPTITSTSHFAMDRMDRWRSVKPPEQPAIRIGLFIEGIFNSSDIQDTYGVCAKAG